MINALSAAALTAKLGVEERCTEAGKAGRPAGKPTGMDGGMATTAD